LIKIEFGAFVKMAENNYLIDLDKQLQEETLEIITITEEELAKLKTDPQCSFCINKIIRAIHAVQRSLNALGYKLYSEHFEKIEMILGFLLVNNLSINPEILKITEQGVRLARKIFALHSEAIISAHKAPPSESTDKTSITLANAEIGKLLSELKKNRKPRLKLDIDLYHEFINDAKKQLTFMAVKLKSFEFNTRDKSVLDDLFRSLHTLKSSSSMYGYKPIEEVIHELENILTLSRDHGILLNEITYRLLQRALNEFKNAIDELADTGSPSSNIVDQLILLIEDLRQYYTGLLSVKNSPL
jgi:two-component system chemotaxis sensor kinase CheA